MIEIIICNDYQPFINRQYEIVQNTPKTKREILKKKFERKKKRVNFAPNF